MDYWCKKIGQAQVILRTLDFGAKIINIGRFQGIFLLHSHYFKSNLVRKPPKVINMNFQTRLYKNEKNLGYF